MAEPETKQPHTHLEIHALVEGGYVVRESRFDRCSDGRDDRSWMPRWELAAFATLKEAVAWLEAQMVNKSPALKSKPR